MYCIHYGSKLGILIVQLINRPHGRIKILHVLRVHYQERRVAEHDIANPPRVCRRFVAAFGGWLAVGGFCVLVLAVGVWRF